MKASDLINLKSEILEPLHVVAQELSEVDARGRGHLIEYTKLDVLAATIVFTHILANKKAHGYVKIRGAKDLETVSKEMEEYGNRIKNIVYDMTGMDLSNEKENYYE